MPLVDEKTENSSKPPKIAGDTNQCTKQERRTITIGKYHELMMEAKEYNKTQAFKDDMKERAHIEPKTAEMKRFHGIANVIGSVCYLKKC